jgi:drug/metabolite transporter (DMT)-like permease
MMGFITALPGVWLVSRPPATAGAWSSEDFGFACLAGIGIGGFLVFMAQVGTGPVFTPLLVARTASLCAGLSLVWMLGLRSVRLHRPLVACLAGCLDAGGNVLYLLATRYGRLDVAAVLSSMYPLTTVTLAYWLQAQSVTRMQSLGVGLCLVAVALMAA